MKIQSVALAAVFAAMLAAPCMAADTKFDTPEAAHKAAASSGKGVFVICYALVRGDKTNIIVQLTDAIKADKEIAADAAKFELAMVNCFSLAAANTNQCVDPALEKIYGWPVTVSVYAPGASKHVWRKEMSHDDVNSRAEHKREALGAMLKEALEAWMKVRTAIDEIEEKIKADKALKTDVETQAQLAEVWAKAGSAINAQKYFDEAIKLAKKAKDDARSEQLTLRRADAIYECEDWALAAKDYAEFCKSYKASANVGPAKIQEARATAKAGAIDKAKTMLQAIIKDKKLESVHGDAKTALSEVEAMPKN